MFPPRHQSPPPPHMIALFLGLHLCLIGAQGKTRVLVRHWDRSPARHLYFMRPKISSSSAVGAAQGIWISPSAWLPHVITPVIIVAFSLPSIKSKELFGYGSDCKHFS